MYFLLFNNIKILYSKPCGQKSYLACKVKNVLKSSQATQRTATRLDWHNTEKKTYYILYIFSGALHLLL